MAILHDKWMPVPQRYKDTPEPDADAFFDKYATDFNHLAASTTPPTLPNIEAVDLETSVSKMKSEKATGLDGWSVEDLKVLPKNCLAHLAELLNVIETTGRWPGPLSKARVTLIPKSGGSTDPGSQRPITVAPTIYRLWATTRLGQCAEWQAKYLPWHMHGFCKGRSVEDGIWQVSMRIEEADARAAPLFGFNMDIAKAFDSVPHTIMFRLAERVGLSPAITRGLKAMYDTLVRRFKFGILGYGPGWQSTNGILQGCPISVLLLNVLMSVWGTRISSLSTTVINGMAETEPEGYADDCCVTSTTKAALCTAIAECETFATKTGLMLAGEKCNIFANAHGATENMGDIMLAGNPLAVQEHFECLGVTIPTRPGGKRGRAAKHYENALARARQIEILGVPRNLRPRILHGFCSSAWPFGYEHSTNP